jgi:pyridoxine 5-phosphate synthase
MEKEGEMYKLKLGVNIDHVATIRNARGGLHPDPVKAAHIAERAGADGITAHLREDRRHISDHDINRLVKEISIPLNLEMAATSEMLEIALNHRPYACCIVPEKREEVTTEGGLDVKNSFDHLLPYVEKLTKAGCRVSLFIDPDEDQIMASSEIGAHVIEIHTGQYCDVNGSSRQEELSRIIKSAELGHSLGMEIHAGHGLTYDTVEDIAAITQIKELNIGHFLIGEAIFSGLDSSILRMRSLMDRGRSRRLSEKTA